MNISREIWVWALWMHFICSLGWTTNWMT